MKIKFKPLKDKFPDVIIEKGDLWNLDFSLASIILPFLKEFKKNKSGAPLVSDEDVPEKLRSTSDKKYMKAKEKLGKDGFDSNLQDKFYFKRYDNVLDQIIWSFEKITDPNQEWPEAFDNIKKNDFHSGIFNPIKANELEKKIQNGLDLFAKYFRSFWI